MSQSRTSRRSDLAPCRLPTALLPTTRLVAAPMFTWLTDCTLTYLGIFTYLDGLTPRDRLIQLPVHRGFLNKEYSYFAKLFEDNCKA